MIITVRCEKCDQEMEERRHQVVTKKMLLQPYYFSSWYYCRDCKKMRTFNAHKVDIPTEIRNAIKSLIQ